MLMQLCLIIALSLARRKYADDIDKGVWRQRERQTETFGGLLLSIQQMIPAGFPETLLLP
jgi:hypothetical protein